MPYLGASPRNINTRSVIDHQEYLGSQADTSTNSGYYTFYVNYTPGNVSVVIRGVHMASSDYTATNGTDVRISTSTITLANDDVIEIIGYGIPSSQILERSDVNITGGQAVNLTQVGASSYKVGTTAVLSEIGGVVTLQNVTLGDSAVPSHSMNFRNRIINGNFDIWQRGDNFSSSSVNEWSADRFRTEGYSLSSTISRQTFIANQTDVPQYPRYYCRVATSSAVSAGQYWAFQQRIEAPQNISYGTYTLSFWIRCTTGSLDAGAFKYGFGSFNEWSSSPALSTTWTKLTHTHTISSFSASDYVSIYLIYLTVSSPSSLSVDIAQVQVEEGTVATPFEHRPYGTELALCQRYYEKSYNLDVAPGTSTQENSFRTLAPRTLSSAVDYMYSVQYKVTKRSSTDLVIYSTDGTQGSVRDISGATNTTLRSSLGGASNLMTSFDIIDTRFYAFHWTATAEL